MPTRMQPQGGQILIGVSDQLKFNPSMLSVRRRKGSVLQLSTAKPDMAVVLARFTASHQGTVAEIGEFVYESPSKYLRIENAEFCSGLVEYTGEENFNDNFVIPISVVPRSNMILTNIYAPEEPLSSSG